MWQPSRQTLSRQPHGAMQAGIAERKIAVVQQRLADALQVLEPAGAAGPAAGDGSLPAGGADALRPAAGGPEPAGSPRSADAMQTDG